MIAANRTRRAIDCGASNNEALQHALRHLAVVECILPHLHLSDAADGQATGLLIELHNVLEFGAEE